MTTSKEKVPRYAIQKLLEPSLRAAFEKARTELEIDPTDVDAQRRFFRAVVTLAAQPLFAQGLPAPVIASQAFEAVVHEHQHRVKQAMNEGQLFGALTPAKA